MGLDLHVYAAITPMVDYVWVKQPPLDTALILLGRLEENSFADSQQI